jgi:hypothetical protein
MIFLSLVYKLISISQALLKKLDAQIVGLISFFTNSTLISLNNVSVVLRQRTHSNTFPSALNENSTLPDAAENAALKLICVETEEATIVRTSNEARQCQGLHMHDSLS